MNLGPRRHDVRHDGVAQLDDAFDHFAGFFFQQTFAMAFADDRADFFFDRFLVGLLRRAAGQRDAAMRRRTRALHTSGSASRPNMFHSGQVRYRNRAAAIRAIDQGSQTVATATSSPSTIAATQNTSHGDDSPAANVCHAHSVPAADGDRDQHRHDHFDAERDAFVMAQDIGEALGRSGEPGRFPPARGARTRAASARRSPPGRTPAEPTIAIQNSASAFTARRSSA